MVGASALIRLGLAEDEEVLVHDEEEVFVPGHARPEALRLGVPLGLDDVLLEDEPGVHECLHNSEGDGGVVAVAPGVTHQDGA